MTLDSDSGLCVPDLICVEWDAFQATSSTELFQKMKFHAMDVLEGEPLMKLHIDNKGRRRLNIEHSVRRGLMAYCSERYGCFTGSALFNRLFA
jgi:hypothetical protein